MTAAKRFIPNDEDRAKALSLFLGPAREVPPSKVVEPQPTQRAWRVKRLGPSAFEVFRKGDRSRFFTSQEAADLWAESESRREGLIR